MQQLIDHTVEEWRVVDRFLGNYRTAEKRAALKEAANMVQTAVLGLKPLVDYDGRLPTITSLGIFAEWVNNLYSPGGGPSPYIAMCCCAEWLAYYFQLNKGDPHWREVAEIVFEKFNRPPRTEYEKNPGRWIRKEIKSFHRRWDKGDGKPAHLPIVQRTLFVAWDYDKQNQRQNEQHRLEDIIFKLAGRENDLLSKALKAGEKRGEWVLKTKEQRQKAIAAARKRSPTLKRIDQEIRQTEAQLAKARKQWSDEDVADRRKASARSEYHWRRAMILDAKKKPRKRSRSTSATT